MSSIPETDDLGARLKCLRLGRGWSLSMMAGRVGVNKSTLSRWETGKTLPRTQELAAAFSALNVPAEDARLYFEAMERPSSRKDEDDAVYPPVGGDLLRALRLRKGWTQEEAARAAGVPRSVLTKWERSDSWPNADRLHALCFVLGATPQETAALTRGRFLPSLVAQTPSCSDALELLRTREREMGIHISRAEHELAVLGLLQLEADAWLLTRRTPQAVDILLGAVSLQTMLTVSLPWHEKQLRPLLRRGREYMRALNAERHPLALTQRIVSLQERRDRDKRGGRKHGSVSPGGATVSRNAATIARSFLDLLPRASICEYEAWIYMEAARSLSGAPEPDVIAVERLVDAGFAVPRPDGRSRAEDPLTVRYAASQYARLGKFGRAIDVMHTLIQSRASSENTTDSKVNAVHNYRMLARIAWAAGEREVAGVALSRAEAIISEMPQHQNLQQALQDMKEELFVKCDQSPMLALL